MCDVTDALVESSTSTPYLLPGPLLWQPPDDVCVRHAYAVCVLHVAFTVHQDCATAKCRAGRCCAQGASPSCAGCNNDAGTCISCGVGMTLVNGVCLGSPGSRCSSDADCEEGDCRQGFCCSKYVSPNCVSCWDSSQWGVRGLCSECDPGFYFDYDTRVCVSTLPGGSECNSDSNCQSNTCKRGVCCMELDYDCGACNATTGWCTNCNIYGWENPSKELFEGVCRGPEGSSCSHDENCIGGRCLDSQCCSASVGPGCSSCIYDSFDSCDRCSPGYFLWNMTCVLGAWAARCSPVDCSKPLGGARVQGRIAAICWVLQLLLALQCLPMLHTFNFQVEAPPSPSPRQPLLAVRLESSQ